MGAPHRGVLDGVWRGTTLLKAQGLCRGRASYLGSASFLSRSLWVRFVLAPPRSDGIFCVCQCLLGGWLRREGGLQGSSLTDTDSEPSVTGLCHTNNPPCRAAHKKSPASCGASKLRKALGGRGVFRRFSRRSRRHRRCWPAVRRLPCCTGTTRRRRRRNHPARSRWRTRPSRPW
jgi:hypothetical protein